MRDAEREAGSMQGARCGTRSRVSRIMPLAEGGAKPLSHQGCPVRRFKLIFFREQERECVHTHTHTHTQHETEFTDIKGTDGLLFPSVFWIASNLPCI